MSKCTDIFLSYKELRLLKKYKKHDGLCKLPGAHRLVTNKLIESDFVCQSPGGMPTPNDKYYLSEFGDNYLNYHKEKIFLKKFPVVISIIALISSFRGEILLLARVIVQLWKNIMEN